MGVLLRGCFLLKPLVPTIQNFFITHWCKQHCYSVYTIARSLQRTSAILLWCPDLMVLPFPANRSKTMAVKHRHNCALMTEIRETSDLHCLTPWMLWTLHSRGMQRRDTPIIASQGYLMMRSIPLCCLFWISVVRAYLYVP